MKIILYITFLIGMLMIFIPILIHHFYVQFSSKVIDEAVKGYKKGTKTLYDAVDDIYAFIPNTKYIAECLETNIYEIHNIVFKIHKDNK